MGNDEIKVKDLSNTSSLSTDNKLMLLTDEANNRVQNITVENALSNIISSNANNSLSVGSDKRLYTPDISGEVGDLDNLITTNKTNIVSAINEVKGDTNAITGEVVSASKGWLEEGKIYQKANWYGEKIYNDVYYYNHSKFDLSKFTPVNSPIITDDGIISNLTTANLVYIPCSSYNLTDATSFIIETEINLTTLSVAQRAFAYGSGTLVQIGTDGKIVFYATSNQAATASAYDIANNAKSTNVLTAGNKYKIAWIFNGTQHLIKVNGVTWITIANSNSVYDYSQSAGISANCTWFSGHNFAPMVGSQDLKTCKIYKNGMPIFSGNKTGIDTIKPADFTAIVNGVSTVNPTLPITGSYLNITADGIASGFSGSDYLTVPVSNLSPIKSYEEIFRIKIPSAFSSGNHYIIGNITDQTGWSFGLQSGYYHIAVGKSGESGWLFDLAQVPNVNPIYDKFYYIRFTWNGSQYLWDYSVDKVNWSSIYSYNSSTFFYNPSYKLLGIGGTSSWYSTKSFGEGSIDLNAFKIYVDGDLIYQPCLLIPYNESSTGSKIVDVAYRDRVIDVFEQYGSANYYTIDEVNQNATLPMGEIYGFIEQKQNSIDNIFEKIVPVYNDNLRIEIGHSAYTTPDNGYIYCPQVNLTASLLLFVQTNASGPVNMVNCESGAKSSFCLPVPKGARITATTEDANLHIYFMPAQG